MRGKNLPANYFAIVLGLLSTGLAYRYAQKVLGFSKYISESILLFAGIVWIFFVIKFLSSGEKIKQEVAHPIKGSFVSLIAITTILLGAALNPYSKKISEVFVYIGIVMQMVYAAYHAGGMWKGTHFDEYTTPAIYLPTVAAGFASAIGLSAISQINLARLFFGAGFFSWLSLESATLHRFRTKNSLPKEARAVMGIQLAPAFVCCASYLSINGGKVDFFAQMLIGYGLLNFIFLIRLFKWIRPESFNVNLWAFSFGLGTMANSGIHMYSDFKYDILGKIGLFMFFTSSILVFMLIIFTFDLIIRGRFFISGE